MPLSTAADGLFDEFCDSLSGVAKHLYEAVLSEAEALDASLYLVGGPVRDLLMHRASKDLDLVTEGDVDTLAKGVAESVGTKAILHRRFGTATVKKDGVRLDLAMARRESYVRSGALPTVVAGTIDEDLQRRDFTINAMALGLSGRHAGLLLDPMGGLDDLNRGVVRILHPKSFEDDATRVFRAVRYEQRLGFRLESGTCERILGALDVGILETVSADRLRRELELMLTEEKAVDMALRAGELGVLRTLYSPLQECGWLRRFQAVEGRVERLELVAALAYPMSIAEGRGFITRLNMPSAWAEVVMGMARLGSMEHVLSDPGLSPSQAFRTLEDWPIASMRAFLALSDNSLIRERLVCFLDSQRFVQPCLRGDDLVDLGVPQGPQIGEVLRLLRDARLNGEISTREEEHALVSKWVADGKL